MEIPSLSPTQVLATAQAKAVGGALCLAPNGVEDYIDNDHQSQVTEQLLKFPEVINEDTVYSETKTMQFSKGIFENAGVPGTSAFMQLNIEGSSPANLERLSFCDTATLDAMAASKLGDEQDSQVRGVFNRALYEEL